MNIEYFLEIFRDPAPRGVFSGSKVLLVFGVCLSFEVGSDAKRKTGRSGRADGSSDLFERWPPPWERFNRCDFTWEPSTEKPCPKPKLFTKRVGGRHLYRLFFFFRTDIMSTKRSFGKTLRWWICFMIYRFTWVVTMLSGARFSPATVCNTVWCSDPSAVEQRSWAHQTIDQKLQEI